MVGLMLIHLLSDRLTFLSAAPRSRWLSLAGGISVAYVFVHILPELARRQERIAEFQAPPAQHLEGEVYLAALVGLLVFYTLERATLRPRTQGAEEGGEAGSGTGVFWVQIGTFALFSVLIGYLLMHPEEPDAWSVLVFFFAIGAHFVVLDHSLLLDHAQSYERIGRWVLAAGVAIGWLVGLVVQVHEVVVGLLFAFVAGAIILNVLKEELPSESQSRLWPLLLGAAGYSTLLLLA